MIFYRILLNVIELIFLLNLKKVINMERVIQSGKGVKKELHLLG